VCDFVLVLVVIHANAHKVPSDGGLGVIDGAGVGGGAEVGIGARVGGGIGELELEDLEDMAVLVVSVVLV
jgi:hypothetical protein